MPALPWERSSERAQQALAESAAVFQAIGNPLYLSWCLEGLAGVAAARGRCAIAARLCAARDALLTSLSATLPPAHPAGYRRTLAKIEHELGPGGVAAARESARGIPIDDLISAALSGRFISR